MNRAHRASCPPASALLLLLPAMLLAAIRHTAKAEERATPDSETVEYAILVTGGELLLGEFPDGHTQFLTRSLRGLGLRCIGSMCVDDQPEAIRGALKYASDRAPLILVTGGLGPTDNDVTRETLSAFTGIPLRENEDVAAAMEQRFHQPREALRENLRRQARVPVEGTYLPNPRGTAVGLVFDQRDRVLVALPGPPSELHPMVEQHLIPWLSQRFGTSQPGASLTVHFVGVGQSQVNGTIDSQIPLPPEATMLSQFDAGRVDFTFSMPDDSPAARTQLDHLRERLLQHLSANIYGFGSMTLEQHVLHRLRERGESAGIAEIGSGGAILAALSGSEELSGAVRSGFVAGNRHELARLLGVDVMVPDHEAENDGVWQVLADAVAERLECDWGLVTGPVSRQNGTLRMPVALRTPEGRVSCEWIPLGDTKPWDRDRLVTRVLDMLRRTLYASSE